MIAEDPVQTRAFLAHEVDAAAVVRLLRGIERLPDGATGALVFGPPRRRAGTVLVEGKRVCWAAAARMEARLTDLLRHRSSPPLSVESVERVYRQCLQNGTPLGEALVSSGLVTAERLRAILCQHTAEGLAALSRYDNLTPKWVPCLQQRYDSRFTFSTTELLARVGALLEEKRAADANGRLEAALDATCTGAAFVQVQNPHQLLPITQVSGERVGVPALIALGRWALDAVTACDRLVNGGRVVVSASPRGDAVIGWNDESIVYAALCDGPIALHRILAKRLRSFHEVS